MTDSDNAQEPSAALALDVDAVTSRLREAGRVGQVIYLPSCPSTNAYAAQLELAADHGQHWALVVAEEQTAGRGRLGRSWVSEPGTGLLFSVALSAPWPPEHLSLLPLFVGLEIAQVVRAHGVPAAVKWPNDIIVTGADASVGKLGGVLLERTEALVVVGVGVNIAAAPETTHAPAAEALVAHGLTLTAGLREVLLADSTAAILAAWDALCAGEHEPLLAAYREACASLGTRVRAELPDGSALVGEAVDIDASGRLLLVPDVDPGPGIPGDVVALAAADIVHLRGH